jgi:putative alpha-1,2-mannosidase
MSKAGSISTSATDCRHDLKAEESKLFRRNKKVTRSAAAVVAAIGMVTLGATAASATLGATAASAAGQTARPSLVKDPASLVNTFIGTSNGGDEFPGAAAPFGMIDWSPDTSSRTISGGYDYGSGSTIGLSVSHLSGRAAPSRKTCRSSRRSGPSGRIR